MRSSQKILMSLASLAALAGGCSNSATPTGSSGGSGATPTGGTAAATGATGGAGATVAAGGTGGAGATGVAGKTGGSGAAGASGGAGGTVVATGGVPAAGAGGMSTGGSTGACTTAGAAKTGMCKATADGVYAMKVDVDVWYRDEVSETGSSLFDDGRGKITIYFRNEIASVCDDGTGGVVTVHPCGTRVPPIYTSLAGGTIQIVFPDELWDKSSIPAYQTTASLDGFDPGSTLTIAKTVGLLGISLTAPDATWPTYDMTATTFMCAGGKSGADCFPDSDGDGKPGITVSIQQTGTPPDPGYMPSAGGAWKYIPAPTMALDALTGNGATSVYTGLRTRVGGSGALSSDCKSGMGAADADDFESRVIDCVMTDGTPCGSAANFVDQNTPTFHVLKTGATPPSPWNANAAVNHAASTGPQSSVVRLGDAPGSFTCTDVRAAFP
jgi:hypothetical protein